MTSRLPGVVNSTMNSQARTGKPGTVASIAEVRQFLVTFYDTMGDEHTDMLIKVGDQLFASRGGEEWCKKLGAPAPWLAKEIMSRIAAKEKPAAAPSVPEKDAVNVMGSRIASATQDIVDGRK